MLFARSSLPVSLGAVALALTACTTLAPPGPAPAPPAPPAPVPVPPKPAATQFIPASYAVLPGWDKDDLRSVWPAFLSSCSVLGKRPDWKESCAVAGQVDASNEPAIRLFFESFLLPHQVLGPDGSDSGLVTGYYEPLLRGARQKGGPYQTPLYKVPDDMISVDLAGVYPELKGLRLRGRLAGKKLVPYLARADIARAGLNGKELLWVDDPVEAFFLEVQGSGRVQLADTRETVRVAYADQNGHPYKSIGRYLVEQGELTAEQASAQGIKTWIGSHPARRQELLNVNPAYVFFKEEKLPDPNLGPKGALGVPLTPQRSVAIDAMQLPLGVPLFLSTTQPNSAVPLQRLVMAQDTGGAIRGPLRVDFFFGFGPEAYENAGRMKQRGNVWVLLPRPLPPAPGAAGSAPRPPAG